MLYLLVAWLLILLGGCSKKVVVYEAELEHDVLKTAEVFTPEQVSTELDHYFKAWAGTRHREGGGDRSGIDCSAFVQQAFEHLFAMSLPRTTEGQVKRGWEIERSQVRPGDLVFFKTGLLSNHVGILVAGRSGPTINADGEGRGAHRH